MRNFILIVLSLVMVSMSCQKDCSRPAQCAQEPAAGPCEALKTRYYFDQETKKCKEFFWGGCQGNVPYETLEACLECECDKRLD